MQFIRDNHGKMTLANMRKSLGKTNITYSTFRDKCQRMGLYRDTSKVKIPNKRFHDNNYWEIPNLLNSFMAGRIAGDGCIYIDKHGTNKFNYKVAVKDECIIDHFIQELKFTGPKTYSHSKSPHSENISHFVNIQIGNFDKNAAALKKWYNICPNKTKRLGPTNLQDEKLNFAYLIGLIDSDGSIEYKKSPRNGKPSIAISFNSSSCDIIKWVKSLIDSKIPIFLKNRIAQVNHHKQDNYYRFYLYGKRAVILFDYLSKFHVPKLERKWGKPEILKYVEEIKVANPEIFINEAL